MNYVLRMDVGTQEARKDAVTDEFRLLGGRGLIAAILNNEVDATCDPLGAENKFVVAPGLLPGTMAPSFGRISFGAKSPLTHGAKETNAGGTAAQKLDRIGIKAIVLEGRPKDDRMWVVKVSADECEFVPAGECAGKRTYETASMLTKRFGDNVGVICIGPAGESLMTGASVAVTDQDGRPTRHGGRGGLGAVMGSKGVKAIVIDDAGSKRVPLQDKRAFADVVKELVGALKEDQGIAGSCSMFGTPGAIMISNTFGSMPTMNYRTGAFEHAEKISGETIKEVNTARGGTMHGCMPGCVVRCSVVYNDADGNHLTSALEYETLSLMGSNLGISDLDAIARLDRMCDELGLDTIEMGSALSQAMAAGHLEFGDAEGALKALEKVEQQSPFGKVLGCGTVAVSKEFGLERIPAVMGQAIPAHDPRACKMAGVTYATSAMGADHTAGISYENPLATEGQVESSRQAQFFLAGVDSVGYCMIAIPSDPAFALATFTRLINARYGTSLNETDIVGMGMNAVKNELEFNRKAGLDYKQVPIPEFITSEALPPQNTVFDVDREEILGIWDDLQ